MEITIREITADVALPFVGQFKKEQVDNKWIDGVRYLGAYCKDRLVGVCGWLKMGDIIRYKCDCVHPNYRGNGIYNLLFEARDKMTESIEHKFCTAFCTKYSLSTYLRHGFCSIKVENNGIVFVRR